MTKSRSRSRAQIAACGTTCCRPCPRTGRLPIPVEQRPPRPVDVDRKAERERLEAEAIGGAPVLQAKAADRLRRAEDENRVAFLIEGWQK
jgi:hypothetical protein